MITLIWLFQFDRRWFCNFPLVHSMWLLATFYCLGLSGLNTYALQKPACNELVIRHLIYQTSCLMLQALLCYILYRRTIIKLDQKQITRYEHREDLKIVITNWWIQKALLSKIGYTVLFLGIIQNILAFYGYSLQNNCPQHIQTIALQVNIIATIVTSIPITFIIVCYVLIKTLTLVTSSLFPNTYIKIRKCFQ
ncbi:hypothetical protein pb186bvf_005914 [Paramecium bursaria]